MNTLHLQLLQAGQESYRDLSEMLSCSDLQQALQRLDLKINQPNLWNDPKIAGQIIKERNKISETLSLLQQAGDDLELYAETINQEGLGDQDCAQLLKLTAQLQTLVFREMMSDPLDNSPCLLSITVGAGGLEAANWVSMLLRMYCRFAEANSFHVEILDQKHSEEHSAICLDSVSIQITGEYAYGFFKSESGVHRLIRNSPFNAANARQTSFAAVQVSADIEDQIKITINDADLDITTMRSSGSGGQAVNKIESAIRIKHLPTGIVVNSRATPSQHTNKRFAMKMLKVKLYEYELQKKKSQENEQVSELSSVSFGYQVRSYTQSPQALTKDHRTKHEVNNFDAIINGDIKSFMLAYLKWNTKSKS